LSELGLPDDFDIEAWMSDAQRPRRSVQLFKRADLMAELDDLERRIETERSARDMDPGLSEGSELVTLERQYESTLEKIHASGITVTVQGLVVDEIEVIEKEIAAEYEGKHFEASQEKGRRMIVAALVSPKLTLPQIRALEKKIGSAQIARVAVAVNEATNQLPHVSADFLRKSS
jgi:hypothetical protein